MDTTKVLQEMEINLQKRFDLLNKRLDIIESNFNNLSKGIDGNFEFLDLKNDKIIKKLKINLEDSETEEPITEISTGF